MTSPLSLLFPAQEWPVLSWTWTLRATQPPQKPNVRSAKKPVQCATATGRSTHFLLVGSTPPGVIPRARCHLGGWLRSRASPRVQNMTPVRSRVMHAVVRENSQPHCPLHAPPKREAVGVRTTRALTPDECGQRHLTLHPPHPNPARQHAAAAQCYAVLPISPRSAFSFPRPLAFRGFVSRVGPVRASCRSCRPHWPHWTNSGSAHGRVTHGVSTPRPTEYRQRQRARKGYPRLGGKATCRSGRGGGANGRAAPSWPGRRPSVCVCVKVSAFCR